MALIIDGVNFNELESEKYWSFPASYKKDPKAETKNMIFSGDYVGSRKMDGAYYRFIKDMDGNMSLQGRSRSVSGAYLDKLDHVPHLMPFFNALPNGTCLLGEIYFPNKEGSSNVTTIMGCLTEKALARQRTGERLNYYVFDVWAYAGESMMRTPIEKRIEVMKKCAGTLGKYDWVQFAKYSEGEELWDRLSAILASGGEGIVITKKGTHPEPGKRTARKTLKVKKQIQETIDCFFTGRASAPARLYTGKEIETWKYWENEVTGEKFVGDFYFDTTRSLTAVTKSYFYGWAGSLEIGVMKDGKVIPIGFLSGLSEEIKANFKDYAMKPIEVTAMEVLETGGLRHAKMVQFRPDLSVEDCTWDKVFK